MIVGINTPSDTQAEQIKASKAIFTSYRVTVCEDITDFTTTDTGLQIQLDSESLRRELFFRNTREHLVGIDKQRMTSDRSLIGNTVFIQTRRKILNLFDTCFDIIKLGIFLKTNGQSRHIPAVHTSVGKITFKRNTEFFCTFIPVFMPGSNKTAHIYEAVFLGGHSHAISQRKHLLYDLLDGLVRIPVLPGLDEIGILHEACRIENNTFAVFVRKGAHLPQVLHGNRLATGGIIGDCHDDERNFVLILLQGCFQFCRIDIAFERHFQLGVFRLIYSTIERYGFTALYMPLCRIKMRVARDNISVMHQMTEKNILCGSSLMGRNYIFKSGQPGNGIFQQKER